MRVCFLLFRSPITFIRQYPENESWELGEKKMPVVDNTTHMGILRSSSNQELNAVEQNFQKARRTTYSLMGAGLHGESGLDPETSISISISKQLIKVWCVQSWSMEARSGTPILISLKRIGKGSKSCGKVCDQKL